jgi:uncharacterized membrane protein YfcA
VDLTLPLTGFLVGTLIGLTGMGGGALMTPFLILILGTRPVVAVGTDLVYSSVTKIFGAWVHSRQQTVDLALVKRLAIGSIPAGLASVALVRWLGDSGADADNAIRHALGFVLMFVAVLLIVRMCNLMPKEIPEGWRATLQGRGTTIAGAIVGALVGFTSVGSGSLLVPYLVCVFPYGAARIVGTDVFHAAILITVTAAGHATGGAVNWPLAFSLMIGSLPGVALGSWMAPRVPARTLRLGLAGLLLITGYNLI